jgi:hypothetical protein
MLHHAQRPDAHGVFITVAEVKKLLPKMGIKQ